MEIIPLGAIGFEKFPVEIAFPLIKSFGIEKVHLEIKKPSPHTPQDIKKLLDSYGLKIHSYHCDFGERYDLTRNEDIEEIYNNIEKELEFAAKLDVEKIVIHPSGSKTNREKGRENFKRTLPYLAKLSEKYNAILWFENMPYNLSYGYSVKELYQDLSDFGYKNFGICFDTGHANINKDQGSVESQLLEGKNLIKFIHAHDNDGSSDQHKFPFTGTINWTKLADTLFSMGYKEDICLEIIEDLNEIKAHLEDGLFEKFKSIFMQTPLDNTP